jgi:hypothetical protein
MRRNKINGKLAEARNEYSNMEMARQNNSTYDTNSDRKEFKHMYWMRAVSE